MYKFQSKESPYGQLNPQQFWGPVLTPNKLNVFFEIHVNDTIAWLGT